MKSRIINAGYAILFLISVYGCSALQKAKESSNIEASHRHRVAQGMSAKKYVKHFHDFYPDYHNLQAKLKVKYEAGNKSYSLRGVIKYVKDSLMILSLYHSSGIPVAKMKLTRDSVFLHNLLNKEFYIRDFSYLDSTFNFSFSLNNVAGILFAEPFIYGDSTLEIKKFKAFKRYKDTSYYAFQSVKNRKIKKYYKKSKKGKNIPRRLIKMTTVQTFFVNRKTLLLSKSEIKDLLHNYSLSAEYLTFDNKLHGKPFVKTEVITVSDGKKTYKLKIKIYKVNEKDKLNLKFKMPVSKQ